MGKTAKRKNLGSNCIIAVVWSGFLSSVIFFLVRVLACGVTVLLQKSWGGGCPPARQIPMAPVGHGLFLRGLCLLPGCHPAPPAAATHSNPNLSTAANLAARGLLGLWGLPLGLLSLRALPQRFRPLSAPSRPLSQWGCSTHQRFSS